MKKHELQLAIEQATSDNRKAVIPFISAGFPSPETFWDQLQKLDDAGADIIEIGVPFSDPVADGPYIEDASRAAIEQGISLEWILEGLRKLKGSLSTKIVLMGYANPFFQHGLERLSDEAKSAGVSGFVIPDLQLGESARFRAAFDPNNLALIPVISSNATPERMREYAEVSQGFVYITTVLGITGGKNELNDKISATLEMARQAFTLPLALGFGLHSPDQLIGLRHLPDAVIIGSALMKHIKEGKDASELIKVWNA